MTQQKDSKTQPTKTNSIKIPIATFENVLDKLNKLLNISNGIQQNFYSLFNIIRATMDFIRRFAKTLKFPLYYPDLKIMRKKDFNNKRLYQNIYSTFVDTLSPIFESFTEQTKQYFCECFLVDEIRRIQFQNPELNITNSPSENLDDKQLLLMKQEFEESHIQYFDRISIEIEPDFFKTHLPPNSICFSKVCIKTICDLVNFLNSLSCNQQAVYCLLYFIHEITQFIDNKFEFPVDNKYDKYINNLNLYEEHFNADAFRTTSRSFLENLTHLFDNISVSDTNQIESMFHLQTMLYEAIDRAKLIAGYWNYFHICFIDFDLTHLW